jgi:hypothetical protein
MNVEVLEFTRRALEKGISREDVADALRRAGWADADIRAASNAFAAIDFPLPVPKPVPYLSAQEVFFYALLFTTLYVSAYNLGALVFHFVDLAFPDAASGLAPGLLATAGANQRAFANEAMRANIAALIVAFPLFLFLFGVITRAMAKDPTKRQSRPRKWLTYLTLFIAAAALIGDLSTLVYSLLGGELTARFVLKVATVAVIAGGTFGYFLTDIRKDERA